MSQERLQQTVEKFQTALKKLDAIKKQLGVITGRVSELKKIAFPEPAPEAAPVQQ